MLYSTELCLNMPEDFPDSEFTQFMAIARRVLLSPNQHPVWVEFAGATNLIGWRFRASSDNWKSYKVSIASISNPTHEDLFKMERALFGMFVSGVSALESAIYAIAALASHPAVLALSFGQAEKRACGPRRLLDWVTPYPQAVALCNVLSRILAAREWSLWVDFRNRMTHRSNLPRINYMTFGAPPPITKPLLFAATSSTPSVDADIAEFDALHSWLASAIRELLVKAGMLASGS